MKKREQKEKLTFDSFLELSKYSESTLCRKYIVPPFSILDARTGYWIKRKREWFSLGIRGVEGRQPDLTKYSDAVMKKQFGRSFKNIDIMKGEAPKFIRGSHKGVLHKSHSGTDGQYKGGSDWRGAGSSVFDPVLCEIIYSWFCPLNGYVLDPFAGGSTRGIVASYLNYNYTGIELRQEQIEANRIQAENIGVSPEWVHGDSYELNAILPENEKYDLIFTCPPYYDLEIYSQKEKDGSAFETYDKFIDWYFEIFKQAETRLKENRFFVVVLGEIRDKNGIYRGFIPDNILCFMELGLKYYNEIILITSIGSLPIRAGKYFDSGKKVGKAHQNVLVFFKGDTSKIKDIFSQKIIKKSLNKTSLVTPIIKDLG